MKPRFASVGRLLLGLYAVLFASVISPAADFTGEAKVLAQLDDAWSASAGKKDLNLLVSFYAADAVAYPPNAPVASDPAAIRAVWAGITDSNYGISWKANSASVSVSGEIGFTAGTFLETIKSADGKLVNAKGKFLCVWKKQKDGSWKAIHDMWNYDAP